MKQAFYSPLLTIINSTNIPLVQCTADHYAANSEIKKLYTKFSISNALCPPLNFEANIGGRIISDVFSRL